MYWRGNTGLQSLSPVLMEDIAIDWACCGYFRSGEHRDWEPLLWPNCSCIKRDACDIGAAWIWKNILYVIKRWWSWKNRRIPNIWREDAYDSFNYRSGLNIWQRREFNPKGCSSNRNIGAELQACHTASHFSSHSSRPNYSRSKTSPKSSRTPFGIISLALVSSQEFSGYSVEVVGSG